MFWVVPSSVVASGNTMMQPEHELNYYLPRFVDMQNSALDLVFEGALGKVLGK